MSSGDTEAGMAVAQGGGFQNRHAALKDARGCIAAGWLLKMSPSSMHVKDKFQKRWFKVRSIAHTLDNLIYPPSAGHPVAVAASAAPPRPRPTGHPRAQERLVVPRSALPGSPARTGTHPHTVARFAPLDKRGGPLSGSLLPRMQIF